MVKVTPANYTREIKTVGNKKNGAIGKYVFVQ